MNGFLELQTAHDLLEKLKYDMILLEQDPVDSYRAFSFFVTAEHLADWLLPGRANDAERRSLRRNSPILETCSHLANGIKHFRTEAKHHNSVSGAQKKGGVFGDVYGNVYGSVYGRGIFIQLEGKAQEQFGNEIDAVELARHILEYWTERIG